MSNEQTQSEPSLEDLVIEAALFLECVGEDYPYKPSQAKHLAFALREHTRLAKKAAQDTQDLYALNPQPVDSNEQVAAPKTLKLWICSHCLAPRLYGSRPECYACGKLLHDTAEYLRLDLHTAALARLEDVVAQAGETSVGWMKKYDDLRAALAKQGSPPTDKHPYNPGRVDTGICQQRWDHDVHKVSPDTVERAREIVDAFRFGYPPVQSLRFLEWEPLVESISAALVEKDARIAQLEKYIASMAQGVVAMADSTRAARTSEQGK